MKILVLTDRDDGCGPMAAAFLRDYSGQLEVVSAGRHPSDGIPALLVAIMRECLIDLGGYQPCDFASLDLSEFDAVYECPDRPCPQNPEEARELRDFVKNDSFLFYRRLLTSVFSNKKAACEKRLFP